MTTYHIIPDGLRGFGVEITSPGRFLSMRGFKTEGDARAWISEQQIADQRAVDAAGFGVRVPIGDLRRTG